MSTSVKEQHYCNTYHARSHEWRRIPGHDDYAIRDDGLIASYKRHPRRPRFLKPARDAYDYATVLLDGKRYYLHHLVARVFLGAPSSGVIVRFKTSNRYDTRAENLSWEPRSCSSSTSAN